MFDYIAPSFVDANLRLAPADGTNTTDYSRSMNSEQGIKLICLIKLILLKTVLHYGKDGPTKRTKISD
jgi:hypothetical protein